MSKISDQQFLTIIDELSKIFSKLTLARKGRVFHKLATTLSGTLKIINNPNIPTHEFFFSDKSYPVLVRFANGVQDDDAASDNRGATIRVLRANAAHYDEALLDLLLTTGECFIVGTAKDFYDWSIANNQQREQMARKDPAISKNAWAMYSHADSYTKLYYYSKVANLFTANNGSQYFVRFRLIPADKSDEEGNVQTSGKILPPDVMQRASNEQRSKTFLHDELKQSIGEARSIKMLLQIQLYPTNNNSDLEYHAALDCTRSWSAAEYLWHDAALLKLTQVIDNSQIEKLMFNTQHAPASLGFITASSVYSYASFNHLRAEVYQRVAAQRTEMIKTDAVNAAAIKPQARKILVVGAGPAGLYTAYKLQQLGHQVTVVEQSAEIGGKCRTLEADGLQFNLGGHVCTAKYQDMRQLMQELKLEVALDSPARFYNIEQRQCVTLSENWSQFLVCYQRYEQEKIKSFPDISQPGYNHIPASLQISANQWFKQNNFELLRDMIGSLFTASGYGYLNDDKIPVAYCIKYMEMLGIDKNLSLNWTPKDGFARVWQKIAEQLPNVRCNVQIERIERTDSMVKIKVNDQVEYYDKLIIACQQHRAFTFLDATIAEQEQFKAVTYWDYYTTLCRVTGLPEQGFYFALPYCAESRYIGHSVAFLHRYPGSNIYSFYAYGNASIDKAEIAKFLTNDIQRMGGQLLEIIHQEKWAFFPHVDSQAMQAGFYNKLEQLQGENNTYYVGSLCNFEGIEPNLNYINKLIEQHFVASQIAKPSLADVSDGHENAEEANNSIAELLNTILNSQVEIALKINSLTSYLQQLIATELDLGDVLPDPDTEFFSLGLDSVKSADIFQKLTQQLKVELEPSVFFDYPTIANLAEYLARHVVPTDHGSRIIDEEVTPPSLQTLLNRIKSSQGMQRQAYLVSYIQLTISETLNLGDILPEPDTEFFSLGLDSVKSADIFQKVCQELAIELEPSVFFDYPTITDLASHVCTVMNNVMVTY